MNERQLAGLKAHIIEQSKGEPVIIDKFETALFEAKVRQYLTKERPLAVCRECGRLFDLSQELDAQEWAFGHDCEVN